MRVGPQDGPRAHEGQSLGRPGVTGPGATAPHVAGPDHPIRWPDRTPHEGVLACGHRPRHLVHSCSSTRPLRRPPPGRLRTLHQRYLLARGASGLPPSLFRLALPRRLLQQDLPDELQHVTAGLLQGSPPPCWAIENDMHKRWPCCSLGRFWAPMVPTAAVRHGVKRLIARAGSPLSLVGEHRPGHAGPRTHEILWRERVRRGLLQPPVPPEAVIAPMAPVGRTGP
jgi:hypothetical protein